MVEQQQSTQKMRMDLANTLRTRIGTQGPRVHELKPPLGVLVSG